MLKAVIEILNKYGEKIERSFLRLCKRRLKIIDDKKFVIIDNAL